MAQPEVDSVAQPDVDSVAQSPAEPVAQPEVDAVEQLAAPDEAPTVASDRFTTTGALLATVADGSVRPPSGKYLIRFWAKRLLTGLPFDAKPNASL